MSVFDAVVEAGLSAGNYAREQGMEYEIVYTDKQGEKKKFSRGPGDDYTDVIEDMPRISSTEGAGAGPELLREEMRARYSHGNLIYCTAKPTEEIVNLLADLKKRRKHVVLFAVIPALLEGNDREDLIAPLRTLEYEEIPYCILSTASELGGGEKD
jgi:hypothetical protein